MREINHVMLLATMKITPMDAAYHLLFVSGHVYNHINCICATVYLEVWSVDDMVLLWASIYTISYMMRLLLIGYTMVLLYLMNILHTCG